jgi:serine protease Do
MAAGCLVLAPAASAPAQSPSALPASLERPSEADRQHRAEWQKELARDAGVLEAQSRVVRAVAKLVGPAVVHIEADVPAENSPQSRRGRQLEEAGSGVIVELKGAFYVLTNHHVVRNAAPKAIRVHLSDGRALHPTKVWCDVESDVGVLAVSAPDLIAAPLGDSRHAEIGDFVLALGSPFGLRNSVTFGIISAKGRRDLPLLNTSLKFMDFLQTDAAINPGNSGGPLVNLQGEIIGINTAIASTSGINEGIGFAIPIDMFMVFARQLIETGKVTLAFLGVDLSAAFGPAMAAELGLPRQMGARVKSIWPHSPAEAAKLKVGDVILEYDNTPVEDDANLVNLVSLTEVGKSVTLLIFRDHKPMTVTVELAEKK